MRRCLQGETEMQYLMRRAKAFNVSTREQPNNVQLWLDFAAFQDATLPRWVGHTHVRALLTSDRVAHQCAAALKTANAAGSSTGCMAAPGIAH